ncbi:hypothetical protein Gotri_000099 [Gossypium trilobum]|uniref:non-specific serine/threonine protein kinase n=1 Tax=Gossypium trilobum TaxID=34281 RepID=A0A7J9FW76_9ROSI|nr:hypothetical protein [Gossypium trilobum]
MIVSFVTEPPWPPIVSSEKNANQEMGNMKFLLALILSNKKLKGPIPSPLTALYKFELLVLDSNLFQGPIPYEIGNLKNLFEMNLSKNKLKGLIPSSLSNSSKLRFLCLDSNLLEGLLPQEMGNFKALSFLNLSNSKLIGPIPSSIGDCSSLQVIYSSKNHINGNIPSKVFRDYSAVDLSKGVHNLVLDLSHNNLIGQIPESLRPLEKVNLSYNSVKGPIPYYLINNFKPDSFGKTRIYVETHQQKSNVPNSNVRKNGDLFSIWNFDGRIAFEDIVEATEDFDIRYCIGIGGYGSVYKAQLPSGIIVSLKKLHRRDAEVPAFETSSKNEAKMLPEIRHKNIVKLYGLCLHNHCMFLIYEYMAREILFFVLANYNKAVELD